MTTNKEINMVPVNELLNRGNDWNTSQSKNAFVRFVAPRVANLTLVAPLEAVAVAQNILIVPVQSVGIVLNVGAKVIYAISGSKAVKNFQENMPNLTDLVRTIARIVTYAVGSVLTATIGVLSPYANFRVQCALGHAINRRQEAIKVALLEAEIAKLAEEAAKKAAEKQVEKKVEKKVAEVAVAAKNDVVAAVADAVQAKAAEVAQEANKFVADVKDVAANISDEVKTAANEINELEEELSDTMTLYETLSETAVTRFANDMYEVGKSITETTITGVEQLAFDALELSKKIANFATFGYFFVEIESA